MFGRVYLMFTSRSDLVCFTFMFTSWSDCVFHNRVSLAQGRLSSGGRAVVL